MFTCCPHKFSIIHFYSINSINTTTVMSCALLFHLCWEMVYIKNLSGTLRVLIQEVLSCIVKSFTEVKKATVGKPSELKQYFWLKEKVFSAERWLWHGSVVVLLKLELWKWTFYWIYYVNNYSTGYSTTAFDLASICFDWSLYYYYYYYYYDLRLHLIFLILFEKPLLQLFTVFSSSSIDQFICIFFIFYFFLFLFWVLPSFSLMYQIVQVFSCVVIWHIQIYLSKSTKDIFLVFSCLWSPVHPSLFQSTNTWTTPQTSRLPTLLPPYLCPHHTILPQHPQPLHPNALPFRHEPPDHIRGNKHQHWTKNFNLHEYGVQHEGDRVTRKFPRTLPVFPTIPLLFHVLPKDQPLDWWKWKYFLKRQNENKVQHLWIIPLHFVWSF